MKDIELPPLPRRSLCEFDGAVEIDLYTKEQMQSYARAAVEADRAQRVPDVEDLKDRLVAISSAVADSDDREAQAIIRTTLELLASTPEPAQQEPSEAEMVCAEAYQVVGCLLSDLGLFETEAARKILDNLSEARMVHQDVLPWESAAQHQEPPQQERKPMTHIKEQARPYQVAQLAPTTGMVAISSAAYIELYERHHGIKE